MTPSQDNWRLKTLIDLGSLGPWPPDAAKVRGRGVGVSHFMFSGNGGRPRRTSQCILQLTWTQSRKSFGQAPQFQVELLISSHRVDLTA